MAESCLTPVPSLIADLFGPEKRTRILALYMCTKAVFCIIASCFGTPVINLAGLNWRNALRITPGFGLFGLLLAVIVMKEPQRGGMEDDKNGDEGTKLNCSCYTNLKQLLKSCHFLTFTAGILCYAYVLGAKYFWVPRIIRQARKDVPIEVYCWTTDCSYDDNLIFGIIKCASDLIGILIGTEISKRYQKKNPNVDALLCGIGLFFCAPFFVLFIFFVEINLPAAYGFIAISRILQAICQVPMVNMKLNLVSPGLRGTASSIQMLFAKLIGKVGSIYFIMLISEAILKHNYTRLSSVQFALTLAPLVAMIGGIVFFTVYLLKQKRAAKPGPEAVISQK
ncbi:protein spinster homolog 1-like [Xenopus tropicalis]|uniref:Protein spinster homolog 1-like n=1 Tax=Xenopus tropicalis TaxID=8364 RepID=A0A8J1JB89_XENTR|nr:protein spinster homolog 1-like [Xenopus tropicalis]